MKDGKKHFEFMWQFYRRWHIPGGSPGAASVCSKLPVLEQELCLCLRLGFFYNLNWYNTQKCYILLFYI